MADANAERAIDPRNAWLMTSLLKDVVAYGTATRALALGRRDLAGKTGTTNENVDAWFCGYNAALVGVAWIGFDQPRTLGANETGSVAALPMWIAYMQKALKGTPEAHLAQPQGIIAARINAETGLRDEAGTLTEYLPGRVSAPRPRRQHGPRRAAGQPGKDIREQIF